MWSSQPRLEFPAMFPATLSAMTCAHVGYITLFLWGQRHPLEDFRDRIIILPHHYYLLSFFLIDYKPESGQGSIKYLPFILPNRILINTNIRWSYTYRHLYQYYNSPFFWLVTTDERAVAIQSHYKKSSILSPWLWSLKLSLTVTVIKTSVLVSNPWTSSIRRVPISL